MYSGDEYKIYLGVPCEQRFLSCTAFSIQEVIRTACLSRSWFVNFVISLLLISAVINPNPKDGTFKITGNGVEGEGTFAESNGKAEIGLHISVTGQGSQAQLVVPAPALADKGEHENISRTTGENGDTETEITFTQDGKIWKIHIKKLRDRSNLSPEGGGDWGLNKVKFSRSPL